MYERPIEIHFVGKKRRREWELKSWVQKVLLLAEKRLAVVVMIEPFVPRGETPLAGWELGPCWLRPIVGRGAIVAFAFSVEVLEAVKPARRQILWVGVDAYPDGGDR